LALSIGPPSRRWRVKDYECETAARVDPRAREVARQWLNFGVVDPPLTAAGARLNRLRKKATNYVILSRRQAPKNLHLPENTGFRSFAPKAGLRMTGLGILFPQVVKPGAAAGQQSRLRSTQRQSFLLTNGSRMCRLTTCKAGMLPLAGPTADNVAPRTTVLQKIKMVIEWPRAQAHPQESSYPIEESSCY
jgi:hypothetical protein